jgi:hypothetical protein
MRTVYGSLPFYDSVDKQDVNRTKAIIPIHCPRTQLPSFEICMGSASVATIAVSTVTSVKLVTSAGAETEIISYFPTIPEVYHPTDTDFNTYIKYNGDTLNTILPLGVYYVKLSVDGYVFYSDYISIDNIYKNLITAWTNSGLEAWAATGTTITNAENSAGDGWCTSDNFTVKKGEVITVVFNFTLTTGTLPYCYIRNAGWTLSSYSVIASGLNVIQLTASWDGNAAISIFKSATNYKFSTTEVFVHRTYSPNYMKIAFHNTDNFGDLLYEDSWTQQVWLEAILNNPSHEMVSVGEEKDGIFIAEKITSKFLYSIIAYISRGLYNTLVRLPQHDDIVITDEVGNTYTPAIGNVFIDPIEWTTYETGKLTIRFNDGSNSAFKWTN